ncbi:MAG TPA: OmpH family outer membrane protein [Polyangiaceae bacterium]
MKIARLGSVVAVCLALGSVSTPVAAESSTKVAVVDTQRAIMETEDGLRMQATLKKLFDSRQRELDKKQVDLQKERDDIEKQRGVLSQEALTKRVEKWQREMMQLQTVFVEYNKEMQKKQNELTQPIFQRAMGLIRRLATQKGLDLIVDKQAVPYVRSDLDLTDQLITLYNSGATPGAEGAAPAPAAAAPAPAAPAAAAKKP